MTLSSYSSRRSLNLLGWCALCAASLCSSSALGGVITLYDPNVGTLPANQGWLSVVLSPATQGLIGGQLDLNSTVSRTSAAGYFSENPFTGGSQHPQMPILSRNPGFAIGFELQVLAEGHNSRDDNGDGKDDRAGFSLIVIAEDLLGLELAFFQNRIWAYAAAGEGANSQFTQAEGVAFDTTAASTRYDLIAQGNDYRLLVGGTQMLAGSLRNYNPSGVSSFINPYDNPSFLFLGDDTSSADSHVRLGKVDVTLYATVPEPSTLVVFVLGAASVIVFREFRRLGAVTKCSSADNAKRREGRWSNLPE